MDNLKRFILETLEKAISLEDVKWWSENYSYKEFKTPEEASEFVYREKERARQQGWGGTEQESRWFANNIPTYKQGKNYKIGMKPKTSKFDWKNIRIKTNSAEELATDGWINIFDGEHLSPPRLMPISDVTPTESHSQTKEGQKKVKDIAQKLLEPNAWFLPIVVDQSGSILDGHHRYEAVVKLKVKTIPVQMVLGRD